ncbi:DUF6000 family protein [Actinoallomurus sp. NPDC050550]|uniref:DUF6000 family protein n=1 Tax=Actinoallomurus sp. NPDC050550 TaxID=3154937 RepID=UPI0033C6A389
MPQNPDGLASRADAFGRYALPGNRYKKLLGGNFMQLQQGEREEFGKALACDARSIPSEKLDELFAGDWRERLTAAWLVGFAERIEFRPVIARLILEGERFAGKGYSFALARFGEIADAEILDRYLCEYLPHLGHVLAQPWALGALMLIDSKLHANYSTKFTRPGGLWENWVQGGEAISYTPNGMMEIIRSWCEFADGCNTLI